MIKISISGDSSSEMKDLVHSAILAAMGPLTEHYPDESFILSIRKDRAPNKPRDIAIEANLAGNHGF